LENKYPNWFEMSHAFRFFENHLSEYKNKKIDCLQIGAYTGDATEWLFNWVLTHPEATLTDVDTWEGSDEEVHKEMDWSEVEQIYTERHKSKIESNNLIKVKSTSDNFFSSNTKQYDFIYVDGNHMASAVLKDGINSYECLKQGGILAFDDYMWSQYKGPAFDPKPAIDSILLCYDGSFEVLEIGLQVWLRKIL